MAKRRKGLGSSAKSHQRYARGDTRFAALNLRNAQMWLRPGQENCEEALSSFRVAAQDAGKAYAEDMHAGSDKRLRRDVLHRELVKVQRALLSRCMCKK